MSELRGARVRLRQPTREDIPAICDAMANYNVVKWLSVVPYPYCEDDAAEFLALLNPDDPVFAIDAGDGLIGMIGVKGGRLGYWLHSDWHGQGIMTEAARLAVSYHFGQTDAPLEVGYFLGNAASARVLDKLGFEPTHQNVVFCTSQGASLAHQELVLTRARWERASAD